MATVWIAVDRADKTNGCLQILPGSHRAGRIEHVKVGEQTGADPERVELLAKVCPLTYVQLDPGDAMIFHCNLLHRSDQNHSQNRRWAYLVCYNRASNDPVYKHHYANYTPLIKVQNSRIKECGTKTPTEGKLFSHGPKRERDSAIEVLERKA
ncbi:probable phytanoyl-CoA dioxygenase [Lingula anatina]|uniref:Probable phytanoyl-CoA dioxygenase n=1 Tax=Lingula anatina TaxID=7574 RepID=A0A1S3IH61_LINAN|nr:probable phytanoyl-CoA dioxygenase [Lingula anatina]|eukprot:XP_013396824.1 probable phytanoyl-CoA dioxygenase [Lingula anatina]